MTTMLLVMQVMTASAVTVTGVGVGYDPELKAAIWRLQNYDSQIAFGIFMYTCSGGTLNDTTMDSGYVKLTVLRNADTNIIKEYKYTSEFYTYVEDYVVSGDSTQLGESVCHVLIYDNYYGNIDETIYNID